MSWSVLAGMALVAGIFFIFPAFAGNNGDKVPPQSGVQLVTPQQVQYGGNTFPCSQYSSSANVGYQINNPRNGAFVVPGAGFSITLSNVTKTSADWSTSDNFRILDLGVNGGSFTAWYRYEPPRIAWPSTSSPTLYNGLDASGATSDTNVHATEKSAGVLYNLSYMTFCYAAPIQTASIAGTVFGDTSNNGAQDAGETGLAGRTVKLLNAAGTTVLATSPATDSTGAFSFGGQVANQSYLVCVDTAAGYQQTLPKTGTTDLASCSGVSATRANGYGFSLGAAGRSGLLFGEVQTATLSGTVYTDVNFNDATTPPPGDDTPYTGGATVRAFQNGVEAANTQSGASGTYQFTLPVGSYVICVDRIATYGQTYPSGGNGNVTPNVAATAGSTGCNTNWAASVSNQGWSVALSTAASEKNFAFVPGAESICNAPQSTHPNYQIQLAEPCKPGQTFVVSYTDGDGNRIASVRPVRNDLLRIPMVEKITWTLPTDGHQLTLIYDDILPYGSQTTALPGDGPIDALTCKLEPRVSEFGLNSLYDSYGTESDKVLRTGQTSCLIKAITSTADGTYVAYIYSAIDGWRSTP